MKKEIYIIKNNVNNLVYIGQAKDSKIRWAGHCSSARHSKHPQIIDKAMRDLGIENFWYEIIENTEDYDNRERYWIEFYQSLTPNGYNKLPGGDGANSGVESANALIRDEFILQEIIKEIQNNEFSLTQIADKYNLNKRIITAINRGTAYKNDNLIYPLRARLSDALEEQDIFNIIYDLIYGRKSIRAIALENHTTPYLVQQINNGNKFFDEENDYPLRKDFRKQEIEQIKQLLKTTSLSMREIGRMCNTSYTMVNHINIGKYHFSKTEQYPIRKTR